jgi:hypothetical protein
MAKRSHARNIRRRIAPIIAVDPGFVVDPVHDVGTPKLSEFWACRVPGFWYERDRGLLELMGPELELLLPELDEKARRLTPGAVARAAGDGGIGAVAKMTGASWQTVADGAAELASGQVAAPGRIRRPGAGRRRLAEADPGLVPALLALVEDSSRGDPESPLLWTTKSANSRPAPLSGTSWHGRAATPE